ncbi:MAG: class I SAM-dependent methyltransferase [Chloroflexi bacterium]|nr:class I SAM-dependent methyltransferase [Chloroflexota bacterium]
MSQRANASLSYSEEYYRLRHRSPAFHAELRWMSRLASPVPHARVLDVGCGAGALVTRLAERGCLSVGVDTNEGALRLAQRAAVASIFVAGASADHLPFSDDVFETVFAQHVIEHFEVPETLVKEWCRVLRPGGRLVLVTPNEQYPDPESYYDPTHYQIFSARRLADLVRREGMTVQTCRTLRPFILTRKLELFTSFAAEWLQFLPPYHCRGASILLSALKPGSHSG